MSSDEREDNTIYKVVVNHEEQYSIWPADRENALGWSDAGKSGTKAECLAYIEEVWTDMRPLGLRKRMEGYDPSGASFYGRAGGGYEAREPGGEQSLHGLFEAQARRTPEA